MLTFTRVKAETSMNIKSDALIMLGELPKVGRSTLSTILSFIQETASSIPRTHYEVIEFFEELRLRNARIVVPTYEDVDKAFNASELIIEKSTQENIKILSCYDRDYPQLLLDLKDKPLVIYCKGNIEAFRSPTVAVIGTREPSAHGVAAGLRLAKHFVESEFVIVSGLAVGCDTVGHASAVEANKPTIAVLAGGLHKVYPKENRMLADIILERNGLLLSEMPIGRNPFKNSFIERDRLQSGISYGVVVIETDVKGGTMHTVKFAEEQNRKIACLYTHPSYGAESHPKFQGNKMLVKAGVAQKLATLEEISNYIRDLQADYLLRNKYAEVAEAPDASHQPGTQLSFFK